MINYKKITAFFVTLALLFNFCFIIPQTQLTLSAAESTAQSAYSVNYLNKNGEGTLMTKEELAAEGTSLIAGQRGIPYAYDAEKDTHKNIWLSSNVTGESLYDAANVLAGLTDGNLETKDFTYFGGTGISAIDFEYDLGKTVTVDKFLFLARNDVGNSSRYTGAYDVYLANSKTDLYKPENKIYSYDCETDGISRCQIVTFNNKSIGRYLAVRVTRPWYTSTSSNYPRLSEIAVYGEEYDPSETADYSVNFLNKNGEGTLMTKEELAAEGTSLIAGQRGIPYAYDAEKDTHKNIWLSSNVTGESLYDAANVLAALTDGNLETKDFTYFGGTGISAIDFEYDLGKTVTVDKFLFLARNDVGNSSRYTGAYDVYLANSKTDLYKPENKIYSYDCETDGISRGQIVTFKNKSAGRYLAVRVTRPWYTSTSYNYPRLSEIAVYGTPDYTVEYAPSAQGGGTLMTDEELDGLGTSLIGGRNAVPYMYDSESGTYVKKYGESSDNYNENGFNGLTDGIVTVDNNVCNKNGQIPEPVYLKYDLGADCKIDSFLLMGTNNTADWINEIYTGAYEVYLSNNEDDLFNTENIIYSYDYKLDGIYRGQIVTFNKQYTGRYIAVRIINPVTTNSHPLGRIAEIAVYGNRVNEDTGDVNGDGYINDSDLTNMKLVLLGITKLDEADVTYYDLHPDSEVNILDLVRLKKIVSKVTENFQ